MTTAASWLDYRVRWRTGEPHPGRHGSRQPGAGGALIGYRPFWQAPDARRLDMRRSLLDAAGEAVVRRTEDRGSITLVIAADLSRSMQAGPAAGTFAAIADLLEAAARSALRAGDRIGFLGFDAAVRADFTMPPGRARGPALAMAARLRDHQPRGRSAAGLEALVESLPPRRCLVLLISDFLLPADLLRRALVSLARHDVAPVMLRAAAECAWPAHGLLRLQDAETGQRRLLWMRPSLRARIAAAAEAQRAACEALFLRHCRPAFHVRGELDTHALGRHLQAS